MSCTVAHSPPHQDDWAGGSGQHDSAYLDAVAEFNGSLADGPGVSEAEIQFDPRVSFFDLESDGFEHGSLGMPQHQQPCSPGAPYYIPSIEASLASSLMVYPSHLQSGHRRSISEPPMDISASHDFHGLPSIPSFSAPAQITFHRSGHYLGRPQQARPLKSLPKTKAGSRGPAYKMKGKEAHQTQHARPLYQVRPPVHRAPTSAPMMYEPEMHAAQHGSRSTRVCTPDPGDFIDPQLGTASSSIPGRDDSGRLTLPVSMEELKGMIDTAVQKAMDASHQNAEPAIDDAGLVKEGEDVI